MNKGPSHWTISLAVFASLCASLVVLTGPALAGARCNTDGRTDLTLTSESRSRPADPTITTHSFFISNKGPACAVDVRLPVVLRSSDGSSLTYQGIESSNSPTWECLAQGPATGARIEVACTLGAAIPANKSAFVTIRVLRQDVLGVRPSVLFSAEVVIPRNTADPSLSDNRVWGSFGTRASSSDFSSERCESGDCDTSQNVEVTRPDERSISINQPRAGESTLAAPAAPPCTPGTTCVLIRQVSVDTESLALAPDTFPVRRITTVVTRLFDLGNLDQAAAFADILLRSTSGDLHVYRYIDFENTQYPIPSWQALQSCQGFTGDSRVGCVASISVSTNPSTVGHLRIELWTTHNGHYQ
jgi:hypothetical protein